MRKFDGPSAELEYMSVDPGVFTSLTIPPLKLLSTISYRTAFAELHHEVYK